MATRKRDGGEVGPIGIFFILVIAVLGVSFLAHLLGWFGEAADVAHEQLGPRALLKKYEWFKDASAALDSKVANIAAAHRRQRSLVDSYEGKSRPKWSREDREQFNLWESEEAGMVASYNNLASEYNAEMVKANWRFANVGDVPAGGAPLPREYREYKQQ